MIDADSTSARLDSQPKFKPSGAVQVPAGASGLLCAAREILKGLRRAYLFETDLRVALMILEWGPCHGRDAAVFPRHQDIADLDGELDRAQVTRAIGRLVERRIVEANGGVYSFRPSGEWRVKSRAREGRQASQAQLELRFERLALQLDLNLYELDAALKESFLAGGQNPSCVSETHSRVAATPDACVSETHGGVTGTPRPSPHTTMVPVHARYSMDHAVEAIAAKAFEVGALGKKTGQEVFNVLVKQTGPLRAEHQIRWWSRIQENAALVWELATEAKECHNIGNKAGWINRGYMRTMKLGQFAEDASRP